MIQNKLTIIIPTLCRPTIDQAIRSVHNQTSNNWYAIVVTDGIDPLQMKQGVFDDDRITVYRGPHQRSASKTRAYGIDKSDTEWVGFLDDDDILNPEYVSRWEQEKQDNDIIIFKMTNYGHDIPSGNFIEHGNVGISFCLRRDILDTIEMPEPPSEDYVLLKRLEIAGAKIFYSNYVGYHVRPWLEGIQV